MFRSDRLLNCRYQTRVEEIDGEEHSSLLRFGVITAVNKFFNRWVCVIIKYFLGVINYIMYYAFGVFCMVLQPQIRVFLARLGYTSRMECHNRPTQVDSRGQYYIFFYGCNLLIFVISQSVCPLQAFPAQSSICG